MRDDKVTKVFGISIYCVSLDNVDEVCELFIFVYVKCVVIIDEEYVVFIVMFGLFILKVNDGLLARNEILLFVFAYV